MTKLIYPEDYLSKYYNNDISQSLNNISSALQQSYFNVPSNFCYKNYLNNCNNSLINYRNRLNNINGILNQIDSSYKNVSDDLSNSALKIENIKIKSRDRMIF